MKKLFSFTTALAIMILMVSQLTLSSCTKTVTSSADNSVSARFLGKQWIVDSLFENYNSSNPGTLVYSRGGTNNAQNLDGYIVIMWPDGTQFFINNGSYVTNTYTFQNSDSTELLLHNPGPDYARIVTLTNTHLTIYDSTNSALSYYEYKP
jgi:hypothetical protein